MTARAYPDLHEHSPRLEERGLLRRIDRPIDKDSEMHPLVRWQFVGGIDGGRAQGVSVHQHRRRTRPHNTIFPVVVGAHRRQSRDLQRRHGRAGRGDPARSGITRSPIRSRRASSTRRRATKWCIEGEALQGEGNGLDALPIPVSTPGFDSAPTLTATNVITQRSGNRRAEHGHLSRGAEGAGPAGRAHGDARRRRRRLSALPEVPEARRQADAVRHRARLPALRRLHGAAEAAARRRRARPSPAGLPGRRSTWCARARSI